MATKKATTTVKKTATKIPSKLPTSPAHPLYGRPILEAVKRGNVAEMKRIATQARAHVKEVNAALAKLDASLKK